MPSRNTYGYVFYYDDWYGEWDIDQAFSTDDEGNFGFATDKEWIKVLTRSCNSAAHVITTLSHSLGEGETVIEYFFGVEITNPQFQDLDVPIDYTVNDIFPAPYHIAEVIKDGSDIFTNMTSDWRLPVWVFWDSLNTQYVNSFFGGYSINGDPIIYINNKYGADDNWDEWDDFVILHEYAHNIIYCHGQMSPYAFGEHHMEHPPDYQTNSSGLTNRKPDVAFNEGIATFLTGIIRGTHVFKDSIYGRYSPTCNMERPLPDAPFVYYQSFEGPSEPNPLYNGSQVEAAVFNGLWDLYDVVDDDNYYIGPILYGHNNDHNSSTGWTGFDNIWDILKNPDPRPDDPEHENCWNFYEFMDEWRKAGYPWNQTFEDIFKAHNVPVFIPGDANHDGVVNVGDAVWLINYALRQGPAPDPIESGDANCDNSVDVGDATFMINAVFKGGPQPELCIEYRFN
ncbi:MAG: dockerin type I repeat-containing protein [Candidatus Zixiibacteriota bacterium]